MKKDFTALVILVAVLILIAYILSSGAPSSFPRTIGPGPTITQNPVPETVPSVPVGPSEMTLTAKVNKSASGLGVIIAPIEVVEDSRCPTDENIRCIQAGTVRVRTKITHGNGERALIFVLGVPVASKTETIELIDVLPPARAEVPILTNEYRFVFKVAQLKTVY